MKDVYDWRADEAVFTPPAPQSRGLVTPDPTKVVDAYQAAGLNQVTGHARGCICPQCPGWYELRARGFNAPEASGPHVPPARKPNPLLDQVLPVSVLMMVFTTCATVLIPVVAPLLGLAVVSALAVVVAIVALVVVLLVLLVVFRRFSRATGGGTGGAPVVPGQVVARRTLLGRWRDGQ